jgi:hypothetical protein
MEGSEAGGQSAYSQAGWSYNHLAGREERIPSSESRANEAVSQTMDHDIGSVFVGDLRASQLCHSTEGPVLAGILDWSVLSCGTSGVVFQIFSQTVGTENGNICAGVALFHPD